MRKKSISLIIALTFLLSLFPMALPAFAAADYERMGSVLSVDDDRVVKLNSVNVEFKKGELKTNDEVVISLPSDFEFATDLAPGDENPDAKDQLEQADWTNMENKTGPTAGYSTNVYLIILPVIN